MGGGVAARAVDGNNSGVWKHNSVSHTCKKAMNTWSVTLGLSVITKIVIWNRTDCCAERIKGAKLDIFNGTKLVASRNIASTTSSYPFDFENVVGSLVKISLANQYLSLAEVQVFGFAVLGPLPPTKPYKKGYSCEGANQKKNLGTKFKTPQECLVAASKDSGCGPSIMWSNSYHSSWGCRCCVPGATYVKANPWDIYLSPSNISKGKKATQSSTCYGGVAARAVDGNNSGVWKHNSVSHTCKTAMNTWSVTLGLSVITKIVIWNRTDCCAERIKGAKLDIF